MHHIAGTVVPKNEIIQGFPALLKSCPSVSIYEPLYDCLNMVLLELLSADETIDWWRWFRHLWATRRATARLDQSFLRLRGSSRIFEDNHHDTSSEVLSLCYGCITMIAYDSIWNHITSHYIIWEEYQDDVGCFFSGIAASLWLCLSQATCDCMSNKRNGNKNREFFIKPYHWVIENIYSYP